MRLLEKQWARYLPLISLWASQHFARPLAAMPSQNVFWYVFAAFTFEGLGTAAAVVPVGHRNHDLVFAFVKTPPGGILLLAGLAPTKAQSAFALPVPAATVY